MQIQNLWKEIQYLLRVIREDNDPKKKESYQDRKYLLKLLAENQDYLYRVPLTDWEIEEIKNLVSDHIEKLFKDVY